MNTPYRDSRAFIAAALAAARQNALTSARATRGTLGNVGKNPLALRGRVFNACEVAT